MTIVRLSMWEMIQGAMGGIYRHSENLATGKALGSYGLADDSDLFWQIHVEGALGECAVAKYLNAYWPGKGDRGGQDTGQGDVRTAKEDYYRLILHPPDPDDRVYWLVVGQYGVYRIVGWIYGHEGKRKEYWTDPGTGRPAYFVPQKAMNRPDTFMSRGNDENERVSAEHGLYSQSSLF